MRKSEKCQLWVVYRMEIHGKVAGGNAVCEQGEWDAIERAHPGHRKLIQAGITSEGDAERLARSSPHVATQVTPKSGPPKKLVAEPNNCSDNAISIFAPSLVGVIPAALPTETDDLLLPVHDEAV